MLNYIYIYIKKLYAAHYVWKYIHVYIQCTYFIPQDKLTSYMLTIKEHKEP